MTYSNQEVAELFSMGKFDEVIKYFNDTIVWELIGESTFEGIDAVVENCKLVAEYFKSVETDFRTNDIFVSDNKVIVIGSAEFRQNGKVIDIISACDIYVFNSDIEIEKISSYCISNKTN
ncbi:nuclear transport factor 2 family protein [Flavobacterium ardleyense]|uniref:nuclear transport factor 2 family protein n=1 Tax=Flavobacterium ardleyense TaxID=2038737 RepID=UPI00298D4DC4|nr:nuclear transport factor 2 family protein [Flavobacterium ardleyense]